MNTLTRKLLIGLLATGLTTCGARTISAAPPKFSKSKSVDLGKFIKTSPNAVKNVLINPNVKLSKYVGPKGKGPKGGFPGSKGKYHPGWHHGHHHPWWHHGHYPGPIYRPIVQPVIVEGYGPDATNPLPAADIQLVNPAENRVTLKFRLNDGELQSLPAGNSIELNQAAVITFDRGGNIGQARYSLTDGAYKFVAAGQSWDLVRQSLQALQYADTDTNPIPGY